MDTTIKSNCYPLKTQQNTNSNYVSMMSELTDNVAQPPTLDQSWGPFSPLPGTTQDSDDPFSDLPDLPDGMVWTQWPPSDGYLSDPAWYDPLGRDVLDQKRIFTLPSPDDQAAAILQVLNDFPSRGLDMLFACAVRGRPHLIRTLLAAGVPPHPGPEDDDSLVAIHAAAFHGHLECVRVLVEEGAVDPDVEDGTGTPLMRAAIAGHAEVVRYLLGTGRVDVRRRLVRNGRERHPLEWIASSGNVETAGILVDSLELAPQEMPTEALRGAAHFGDVDVLRLFLELGGFPPSDGSRAGEGRRVSPEQQEMLQEAIVSAAAAGKLEALRLLLAYLEQPEEVTKFRAEGEVREAFSSAMLEAAAENNEELFSFLFDFMFQGTDYDKEEMDKILGLGLFQAAHSASLEMVKHLIEERGANPNDSSHNPHNIPALSMAAGSGHLAVMQYLLSGAPVKADIHLGAGANGMTALWYAVRDRRVDAVLLLLQHGGPIDEVHPAAKPDFENTDNTFLRVVSFMNDRREVRIYLAESEADAVDKSLIRSSADIRGLSKSDETWWDKLQYRGG